MGQWCDLGFGFDGFDGFDGDQVVFARCCRRESSKRRRGRTGRAQVELDSDSRIGRGRRNCI